MLQPFKTSLIAGTLAITALTNSPASSSPVDGTAFLKSLVAQELRKGEKNCRKTMRKTAKCKIHIKKVTITKKSDDTADIEVISDLQISTKFLIKASANAEIIAKATYQLRSCEIDVTDVSKKITKLDGAAAYLGPFKSSISNIEVPTGVQPIKSTATRDKADSFLEKKLKLVSSNEAKPCEK